MIRRLQRSPMIPVDAELVGSRHALVLHLFAFAVSASAVVAVAVTIDLPEFTTLLYGLLILGHVTSLAVRALPIALPLKRLVSLIVVAVIARVLIVHPPAGVDMLPPELFAQEDLSILVGVTYLLLASDFFLTDVIGFLWPLVPAISIFGLVGQLNVNVESLAAFLCFLLFMIAMLGWLHLNPSPAGGKSLSARNVPPTVGHRLAEHLYLSSLLFLAVAVVGFGLGIGLKAATPAPFAEGLSRARSRVVENLKSWTYLGFSDSFQVGTGPQFVSNAPVFYARTSQEAYWRVRTYVDYTGFVWLGEQTYAGPLSPQGTVLAVVEDAYPLEPRDDHETVIHQSVFLPIRRSGYIPAAATPIFVHSPWSPVLIGPSGSILASRPIPDGGYYEVVSRANTLDPTVLRQASRGSPGNYPRLIWLEGYLNTANVSRALAQVAHEVVRGNSNAFDKVMALQQYLETTCVYDLGAARYSRRESALDVASQFVLERRDGVCSEFATALAIMSRLVGLPARVATGYTAGTYDRDLEAYVVREKNVHAWAEIYFPAIGWVPFSPVPTRVTSGPVLTRTFSFLSGVSRSFNGFIRRNLIWLVMIFPLLWAVGYANAHRMSIVRGWLIRPPRTPRFEAARMWRDLARSLGRIWVAHAPHQGPWEYFECLAPALRERDAELSGEVEEAIRALASVLYGPGPALPARLSALKARIGQIRRRLGRMRPLQAPADSGPARAAFRPVFRSLASIWRRGTKATGRSGSGPRSPTAG